MNSYVLDAVHRASHGVELPPSEVKTLVVGATDIIEAFEAQILFLKRELNWRDDHIARLEKQLGIAKGGEEV